MKMKIGNDRTPQKAVDKMNEVAAGIHSIEEDDECLALGMPGRVQFVYRGDATVDGRPIDGSAICPMHDTEGKVQNMVITPPGGGDLLIPFAPIEASFGRIGDGKGTLHITEDWSDAWAVHAATGQSAVITMCVDNLPPVGLALRKKFPNRDIIVCSRGSDAAVRIAEKTACKIAAKVAYPTDATCFSQMYDKNGREAVEDAVAAAKHADSSDGYDDIESDDIESDDIESDEPVLWPRPVDGYGLIRDLRRLLNSYLSLPAGAAVTIALYVLFTYTVSVARVAPILSVLSVERRCGKTTLLSLLTKLVFRPVSSSNLSPAALYRAVAEKRPCLLLDEADTYLGQSSELTGIINSGHTRDTAFVLRAAPGKKGTMKFPTFCAKVIAMIGVPPDTILDRSIVVNVPRKLKSEGKKKLQPEPSTEIAALRSRVARFAADNLASIKCVEFEPPELSNDRLADSWHPLLSIASVIGPKCFAKACDAAQVLSGETRAFNAGPEELLRDIKAAYDRTGEIKMSSERLIHEICEDEESPWPTFNRGKPITQRQLAKSLHPFGISSKNLHIGGHVLKGHEREDFADAFARYVPDSRR